jgi:hypothetical protein
VLNKTDLVGSRCEVSVDDVRARVAPAFVHLCSAADGTGVDQVSRAVQLLENIFLICVYIGVW